MDRRAFLELTSRGITAAAALSAVPLRSLARDRMASGGRPLFEDAGIAAPERDLPHRSTLVHLDAAALDDEFMFSIAGNTLANVVAVREETAAVENFRFSTDGGRSVSTLTRKGPMVAGLFETFNGQYAIRPLVGSWHLLVPTEGERFTCRTHLAPLTVTHQALGKRHRAVRSGPPVETVTVRIGLWFHSRFAAYVGGMDHATLLCENITAGQNTVLRESRNTFLQVELAVADLIDAPGKGLDFDRPDYSQALEISEALYRFSDDPYIHSVRFQDRVSIAGYLDRSIPIGAGGAYTHRGMPWTKSGMWAGEWGTVGGGSMIPHEIGHSFGLNHDRSTAPAGEIPYSYGFIDCEHKVSCVMSSGPCFARSQLLYSNPLHRHDGTPFGSAVAGEESDAARLIRENRYVIRDFWRYASQDSN